jgi:hypothetical protein
VNNAIKRNGFFSKLLEVVLEEKRREIIKERIKKGKYNINNNGFQL